MTEEGSPRLEPGEVEDLFARLGALAAELSEGQRALLGAILKIAMDVCDDSEVDDRPFSEQFAAAFSASHADRILAYGHHKGLVTPHTEAIIRSLSATISSTPPAIIRSAIIRDDRKP
jgi:hypothetical protein